MFNFWRWNWTAGETPAPNASSREVMEGNRGTIAAPGGWGRSVRFSPYMPEYDMWAEKNLQCMSPIQSIR